MPLNLRSKLLPQHVLLIVALVAGAPASAAGPDEAAFLAESDAVMNGMMAATPVKPTGDVDKDFVAMMTPHHQAAIDMAQAVLRYGQNEQIRRLAHKIIVTQQQEITTMRMALGEPLSAPSATVGQ